MQTIKAFLGSKFEIVAEMAEGHMELTEAQMEMLNGGEEGEGSGGPPPPPPEEGT
ncbi:hypothetical protein H6G33_34355 [Calothrix sp. FACHB-1219]|uniref:hypothetical protein n=1 Tax=unclassified Calothrix TaxID=2619626 RepID=UPI0016846877|nr:MULTISPECIES: hypothetical protein [unclassified Calothrix]MBD2207474.1 hypothetical protein [Calothrix sp. FACHB-168]MBD2222026.1 hypothetical protein [Calothrix sp. FACHB-1219]